MINFALLGVAGFIAPRHLEAIKATGHRLVVAADPHDTAGILDRYFPEAEFLLDQWAFEEHLRHGRRRGVDHTVQYVSVCTPNDLHLGHVELALKLGADAICEKPLVVDPEQLSTLQRLEEATGRRVFTIMQLRHHPSVLHLQHRLRSFDRRHIFQVRLDYVTPRGPWYQASWKGDGRRSGGLAMNIGIHLFDLLLWLFGSVRHVVVERNEPNRLVGSLSLERAEVEWLLSIDRSDLSEERRVGGCGSHREIVVDGEAIDLSAGFQDLHTRCYAEILAGRGPVIEDVRPSLELASAICRSPMPGRSWSPLGIGLGDAAEASL